MEFGYVQELFPFTGATLCEWARY